MTLASICIFLAKGIRADRVDVKFACLSIGIEYSKFQQLSVSHRGATSTPCEV